MDNKIAERFFLLMNVPGIWTRPGLVFPQLFDTFFFDVDGVLIKTINSFRATDIAVVEYVVGKMQGLDWGQEAGKLLVKLEDIAIFKQAGGYNNDWVMSYLLASLLTARLREWRGTALAERSMQEWAELARVAHLQGHGGKEWVDATIPASARFDYQLIVEIYKELYWGAREFKQRFGQEPCYLPDAAGAVQYEEMLYPASLMGQLRKAGIQHLGMITGRIGPEVDSALERMEVYSGERWWDVVVPSTLYEKPDPQALRFAIETVHAQGGLYIGDTADDFDLVMRYRANKKASEPEILAVMLVGEEEDELYQQRGADIIVRSVENLLACLIS